MFITDKKEMGEILANSPILRKGHISNKNPFDFGSSETVPCELKRVNKKFPDMDMREDFGRYLGNHPQGYCVGIYDIVKDETAFLEVRMPLWKIQVFDSLDALKREWQLD